MDVEPSGLAEPVKTNPPRGDNDAGDDPDVGRQGGRKRGKRGGANQKAKDEAFARKCVRVTPDSGAGMDHVAGKRCVNMHRTCDAKVQDDDVNVTTGSSDDSKSARAPTGGRSVSGPSTVAPTPDRKPESESEPAVERPKRAAISPWLFGGAAQGLLKQEGISADDAPNVFSKTPSSSASEERDDNDDFWEPSAAKGRNLSPPQSRKREKYEDDADAMPPPPVPKKKRNDRSGSASPRAIGLPPPPVGCKTF